MSEELEDLDSKTIQTLDLPRTVQSGRGLFGLKLPKVIIPVYITNDPDRIPHARKNQPAIAITSAGKLFSSPIDKIRTVFNVDLSYVATATAGTRSFIIRTLDKELNIVSKYVFDTSISAGLSKTFSIGRGAESDVSSSVVSINYPISLSPEWSIIFDDQSDIDNLDTVAWRIEYQEVTI